jgi:transposase
VGHYFSSRSYARAADEFRREYPDSAVPNNSTITRIINRFQKCGSVSDRKRSGRPVILTEAKLFINVININSKCCMSCSLCIIPAKYNC